MAPQLEFEEGTSFYGAVEIAPKVEERKTNRSKTLKFLVGVAFIAVAVTAAVFAFTSPVSNKSVSIVDVDSAGSCFCMSACIDIEGYHKEGQCTTGGDTGCVDVLGEAPQACESTVTALYPDAINCATCYIIEGDNPCSENPCNGGTCVDRAADRNADSRDPNNKGYECFCPFGYMGANCGQKIDFCTDTSVQLQFCSNGKMDRECDPNLGDEDCKFIFQADSDEPSKCIHAGTHVCDSFATCTLVPLTEANQPGYSCKCMEGYEGDGFTPDQSNVAWGPVLSSSCDNTKAVDGEEVSVPMVVEHGFLERPCDPETLEYNWAGCNYISGCSMKGATAKGLEDQWTEDHGICSNGATCNDEYPNSNLIFDASCTCVTTSRDGNEYDLWSGTYCEVDVDECDTPEICGADTIGICKNLNPAGEGERAEHGYDCSCNTGWVPNPIPWTTENTWNACQDEDDCSLMPNNPCVHGTCSNGKDGDGLYICACSKGWKGKHCDEDIDECEQDKIGYATCALGDKQECKNTVVDPDSDPTMDGNEEGWYCVCNEHYTWEESPENLKFPGVDNTCVDYDDCLDFPCFNAATCQNLGFSVPHDWKCICPFGWEGDLCDEDIDECSFVKTVDFDMGAQGSGSDVVHDCLDQDTLCINTDGSWDCQCNQGWYGDGIHFCKDIDDCKRFETLPLFCANDMSPCKVKDAAGCGGKCVYGSDNESYDTLISFTPCSDVSECVADENLKKVGPIAEIWECSKQYDICTDDVALTVDAYPKTVEDWDIVDGYLVEVYSLTAASLFVSPAPWVLRKKSLDENDEDTVHQCGVYDALTDKFDVHGTCEDEGANSFICDCHHGWADSNCDLDVDECAAEIDDCHKFAKCVNTPGTYECECKFGYQDGNVQCREHSGSGEGCGRLCQDIDDCTTGPKEGMSYKCLHGQCRDVGVNAYRCKCTEGWEDFNCDADINECGLMRDECDTNFGECSNTDGSYSCACLHGYFGTGLTGECTAIDDCANSPCEHGTCTDEGDFAYSCSCDKGWTDKKCDFDLNECIADQGPQAHDCHAAGRCVNTPGSFYCRCVSGFAGDGYTCTDLDDCDPDPCPTPEIQCRAVGHAKKTGRFTCYEDQPFEWEKRVGPLGCKDYGANSYKCEMCAGWDADALTDINECQKGDTNQCAPSGSICVNTIGSYNCQCEEGYYDPCICEDAPEDDNACTTCNTAAGESCMPGRVCNKCTNCQSGMDTPTSKYNCENDEYLAEDKWYFPRDPQFNGKKPTNPGRTTGKGFKNKPNSQCVHTDYECVNINECQTLALEQIDTYNGGKCDPEALCMDQCGTVTCACKGLMPECKEENDCWFGDGSTCNTCKVCGVHECEAFAPTSTTDRVCKPLVANGKYAIETTSGHTAQCLVKWGEPQKVFPERYNWGGKVPNQNGGSTTGMDAADLCENPICGVCNWNGKSAKENLLAGGEAAWTFKHLEGENYLIMSAADGNGYRCLGFRAPGAPYPEMLSWISENEWDSTGQCKFSTCVYSGVTSADIDTLHPYQGTPCLLKSDCEEALDADAASRLDSVECKNENCINSMDCGQTGVCADDGLTVCFKDSQCKGDNCVIETWAGINDNGKCNIGLEPCNTDSDCGLDTDECSYEICNVEEAPITCNIARSECVKESHATGMWTAAPPVQIVTDWTDYLCGMDTQELLIGDAMVVWNLKPLGQRSSTRDIGLCHAQKKCDEQLYDGLFVFRSKARGAGYECLHFKDRDMSQFSHPTRAMVGIGNFAVPSSLCGINIIGDATDEEMLIKNKNAVFKMIPLF